jgi:hypothetical protein
VPEPSVVGAPTWGRSRRGSLPSAAMKKLLLLAVLAMLATVAAKKVKAA